MKIYLMEKAWCDPLENRNDFGYKMVGYVGSEDVAKEIVAEAGFLRGDETWSLSFAKPNTIPVMRYSELMPYK
jgi:hypothetical protein